MNRREKELKISKLVARAWSNPAVYQELVDNPGRVLRSAGVLAISSLAVVSIVAQEGAMAHTLRIEEGQEVYEAPLKSSTHLSDEKLSLELSTQIGVRFCFERICT